MTNPYAVQLGDWRASGPGYTDGNGNTWYLSPLEGWRTGGPRRAEFENKDRQDGAFDDWTFAGARVITVNGKLHSPSMIERDRAADLITGMLGQGEMGRLLVTEAHMTRYCDVRLSDEPTCDPINARTSLFSLQLTAPDGRRFNAQPGYAETSLRTTGTGGLNFGGDALVYHNLQANPYLATVATGWDAQPSASVTEGRQAVTGFARGFAYRATVSTAGYVLMLSPAIAVEPGYTYRFLQWARSSRAQAAELRVQWLDSLGAVVGEEAGSSAVLAANTPAARTVIADSPANAVQARAFLAVLATQVGDVVDSTMALATRTGDAVDYFDGASSGGSWDGTAGNSASTLTVGVSGLGFDLDFGTAGNPGQMVLLNQGTVTVEPKLTVFGPSAPFRLLAAETGGELYYAESLASGDRVQIDIADKLVTLNDMASRFTSLTKKDFNDFVLRPGIPLTVGFQAENDENGEAIAVAEWNDGYR